MPKQKPEVTAEVEQTMQELADLTQAMTASDPATAAIPVHAAPAQDEVDALEVARATVARAVEAATPPAPAPAPSPEALEALVARLRDENPGREIVVYPTGTVEIR